MVVNLVSASVSATCPFTFSSWHLTSLVIDKDATFYEVTMQDAVQLPWSGMWCVHGALELVLGVRGNRGEREELGSFRAE